MYWQTDLQQDAYFVMEEKNEENHINTGKKLSKIRTQSEARQTTSVWTQKTEATTAKKTSEESPQIRYTSLLLKYR